MTEKNLKILNYNKLWLDNKILTIDLLQTQINEFETGTDTNKEHYRYRTFKNYLQTQSSLTNGQILQLFDIIKTDPDTSMAIAMGLDILKTKSLNIEQFQFAADNLKQVFGDEMQKYIDKEIMWRQKRERH
jgi:hypothetical protein